MSLLVELFLLSTVLMAGTALAIVLLRRRSAAERCFVWGLLFAGLLLLPVLRGRLPTWSAPPPLAATARTVVTVTAFSAAAAPRETPWLPLYFAGSLLAVTRLLWAYRQTARLRRHAVVLTPGIRLSAQVEVPVVVGLFLPVILLPTSSTRWTDEERALVLAHESMHMERRDNLWQALAQLACCLYWAHPLVWLCARAMRQECERAADDGVLVDGNTATAYAAVLVNIARGLTRRDAAPAGGLAMTRTTQLQRRISALLDGTASRRPLTRAFAGWAGSAAIFAVLATASNAAYAQQSRLSGVVKDASGASIPRARVDLRTPGTDDVREGLYSNVAGEFALDNIPDGVYDLTVAAPGFARLTQTGVAFESGKTKPFVLTLNVGKLFERVNVSGTISPAPVSGVSPSRIRVGGNVQAVKIVYRPVPSYPATAKADKVQGTVLLRAVIGKDGSVLSLEPLNKAVDQRLVDASLDAVKLWKYTPTLLNGAPVEVLTEIDVNFTLAP